MKNKNDNNVYKKNKMISMGGYCGIHEQIQEHKRYCF